MLFASTRYSSGYGFIEDTLAVCYQGSGLPSRKKPPVGPESGRVAAQTTLAAPSATGRPPGPPMSVATQPGQTALTRIPAGRSPAASVRVSAFSPALDTW